MDFSANNTALWNSVIQLGIIAGLLLLANILRRKIPFVRKSLMPTAVLGGFLLLGLQSLNILPIDPNFLETITYHAIALGFIALTLRISKPDNTVSTPLEQPKSGALIVSTYLIQGIIGLVITLVLFYTIMPELFPASGILLPMGYGQGPGQANNIGASYEALGFAGGRSFGLSIAAAGYLCACIVGVIYINVLARQKKIKLTNHDEVSEAVTVDEFQDQGEIPISESVDRLSIQVALVLLVYFLTFLVTWGITALLEKYLPGVANMVSSLLWGFNFIIGSLVAMGLKGMLKGLKSAKLIKRQYQNNHLLSRISGFAFDIMIIAGIGSIRIEDLSGLWLPFIILSVAGGVVTLVYLMWTCRKIYPKYYHEGLTSMYGMLTGTISSGVLLLREIDPEFKTPAANNLVVGSSYGIAFGAPMLVLVGIAPESPFLVLGLMVVYLAALLAFLLFAGRKKKKK